MGPAGRRLHIAHRRSPSELTPLMSMPNSRFEHIPKADIFIQWSNLLLHSKLKYSSSSNSRLLHNTNNTSTWA